MTSNDDNLYRGDAPAPSAPGYSPPPGNGPAPGYGPPGFGPPGFGPPGFGPPEFGPPPGYGPPGYGPPGYPPPAYYRRPTNTNAILALVFAFVFAPVGLFLGISARKQIRQTGEEGDGLALAGIIVGGIVTGLYVLLVVFWIIAFASFTSYAVP